MRWLAKALVLALVAAVLLAPIRPASAGPAAPTVPAQCTSALGAKLALRTEQRNAGNEVVRRAEAGSPPLQYQPDAASGYTPVLLVHGFDGGPGFSTAGPAKSGPFDKPITFNAGGEPLTDSPRSLVGQLQSIRGAAVFELDYHDRNRQWVAGTDNAGDRVAKAIDCLSAGFGRKVVVVAHSMGGLATRWAVTEADGAAERADRVSTVVTFGTPYTGSAIATAAARLLGKQGADKMADGIAEIVKLYNRLTGACNGKSDAACDVVHSLLSPLDTPAAKALRIASEQLSNAKHWPGQIRVFALAGQIQLQGRLCTTLGCLAASPRKFGDSTVLEDSATADATEHVTVTCNYVYDGDVPSFVSAARSAMQGPCQHSNLMAEIHLTNNAVAEVAEAMTGALPDPAQACATGSADCHPPVLEPQGIRFEGTGSLAFGRSCTDVIVPTTAVFGQPQMLDSNVVYANWLVLYCRTGDNIFIGWSYYGIDPSAITPPLNLATSEGYRVGDDGTPITRIEVGSKSSIDGKTSFAEAPSGVTYLLDASTYQVHGFNAGRFR